MSTFRKTWARNDTSALLAFDVIRFGGTKSLFSTATPVGSANYNFTAIAFFVAAEMAILSSIVMGAASYVSGRSLSDDRYLSYSPSKPVAKGSGDGKKSMRCDSFHVSNIALCQCTQ
ncbi:hypothetical protein BJ742DRAFT_855630 [Cladochytrium replicatum]|nr:hypothetical protein BJ742DRAFT_855630 [Cladochytrium replicatum]